MVCRGRHGVYADAAPDPGSCLAIGRLRFGANSQELRGKFTGAQRENPLEMCSMQSGRHAMSAVRCSEWGASQFLPPRAAVVAASGKISPFGTHDETDHDNKESSDEARDGSRGPQ